MAKSKLWQKPKSLPDDEILEALKAQQGEIPGGEPVAARVESGPLGSVLVHRFYLTIQDYSYRLLSILDDPTDRDHVTIDLGYEQLTVKRQNFEKELGLVLNSEDTWRLILSLQEAAKATA